MEGKINSTYTLCYSENRDVAPGMQCDYCYVTYDGLLELLELWRETSLQSETNEQQVSSLQSTPVGR
jgi:hypothetical protein